MDRKLGIIIAAGGSSRRYGEKDKLLEMLGDLPVFLHCIRNFSEICDQQNMVVAVRSEAIEEYRRSAASHLPKFTFKFVPGGATRSDSVRNALAALPADCTLIAIHDAARPLTSSGVLKKVAERAALCGGAIAAVPVVDSLKLTDGSNKITAPVSRDALYRAETPQIFDSAKLRRAYELAGEDGATDDAEIMRRAGYPVEVVDSECFNLKLTSSGDLAILKIFYEAGR